MCAILSSSNKPKMSGVRRLEGKVAIVTGSTSGYACILYLCLRAVASCAVSSYVVFRRIGFSIARRLAQDGAKVMVSSRKQANVDRAVQSLRSEPGNLIVEGVVCYVGSYEERRRLVEEVGYSILQYDIIPISFSLVC